MKTSARKSITRFFDAYEARLAGALGDPPKVDVEGTIAAFADCFVEASPKGVICSKNDKTFRDSIPKGMEFYRSIGTQSMKIASRKITALDDFHAMVKIHWKAHYLKKDKTETDVEFDEIYFVQVLNNVVKIFSYVSGDEEKLYKDMGLVLDKG